MKLKTSIPRPDFPFRIAYEHKLMSMGSCFAEHIGRRLEHRLFDSCINPFGIIYHPLPIANALHRLLDDKKYTADDLIFQDELYHSMDHHGQYSSPNAAKALEKINKSIELGRAHLLKTNYLFITLGTSWAYYHKDNDQCVANCHKLPQDRFNKKMSSLAELTGTWMPLLKNIRKVNPTIEFIFSVSPVRHLKDGLRANQLSKSLLHLFINTIQQRISSLHYFPAYELMIDELRDYRFYATDLLHPNELAQSYIWQFFSETVFSKSMQSSIQHIEQLNKAVSHRPFHPELAAHQQFVHAQLQKIKELQEKMPTVNFENLLLQFSDQLIK